MLKSLSPHFLITNNQTMSHSHHHYHDHSHDQNTTTTTTTTTNDNGSVTMVANHSKRNGTTATCHHDHHQLTLITTIQW